MVKYLKFQEINKNEHIKKHFQSNNQTDQEKFEEWWQSPSFSFVILFFKFIKEDYYHTGDISIFKSYFEENCQEFQKYLINVQEINNTIVKNNYISTSLMNPAKDMQKKLLAMSEKMEEYRRNNLAISEELNQNLTYEQRRFQKFNEETLGKYTPDLKSLLSNYDTLGQTTDLTNLDTILASKNGYALLDTFFDPDEESELEGADRISAFLLRFTHAIYGALKDPYVVIESNNCHFQNEFLFFTSFEKDLKNFQNVKKGGYFYLIQEISNAKLTYGMFVYFKFKKVKFYFYHPNQGVLEFSHEDIYKFKQFFTNLSKIYGKNYCSFRIYIPEKIKHKETNEEIISATLFTILKQSAYSYKEYIQANKYYFLSTELREENKYCDDILSQLSNEENVTKTISQFFIKFSEFIFKLKYGNFIIQKKSFFLIFLINYLTRFDKFSKQELNTLQIGLGTDKIADYVHYFFNNKNLEKEKLAQKKICVIFIAIYSHICKVDHRIPYYKHFYPFELTTKHNLLFQHIFVSFDDDYKTTLIDWNRQAIIYNERYISGRFDGKFHPNFTIEHIGKTLPLPTKNIPSKEQLEKHFLAATQSSDHKLMEFCLGVCNQTHLFGIRHILTAYFNIQHSILLSLNKKYIYIQKISQNCYDFMVLFYIDQYNNVGGETNELIKLKEPIYFSYVFMLETDDKTLKIKNFKLGYLNKTKNNLFSEQLKEKLLQALTNDIFFQFYQNKKNNFINITI